MQHASRESIGFEVSFTGRAAFNWATVLGCVRDNTLDRVAPGSILLGPTT